MGQPTLDPGRAARYILGSGVRVSDNPWSAAGSARRNPEAGLPNVTDLISACTTELQKDFVPWILAGLPPALLAIVLGLGGAAMVYVGAFFGLAAGLAAQDEDLAVLGATTTLVALLLVLIVVMGLVFTPLQASMWRSVWKYLTEGEKLGFDACFRYAFQDLPRVVMYQLVFGAIVTVGVMMCYLPGILASIALLFAYPAVVVHGMPIGQAMRTSVTHVQANPAWHLGLFAVTFVMALVLPYLPIVGYALLFTLYPLLVLSAWRGIWGDGPPSASVE